MRLKTYIVLSYITLAACKPTTGSHTALLQDTGSWPASFHIGRRATLAEINALDIDIRPDGKGLPPGQGNALSGQTIYTAKCAACHGTGTAAMNVQLPGPALMNDSAGANRKKLRTIGNYWPYATTIFDYIRRSMPYNAPGTLTPDEVYSITAYLLYANRIIDQQTMMNAASLPAVEMPAKKLFIADDRQGGPEIR
ncbi:cytochrome c [Chitinophaga agrisoli]|uniref:Cytochrome c n=1 Tax=Chitinophaga agrisoli TaxID=2607653 RepID=A0A5B2VPY9_9BACT|nr:cytochrome c [Chitinophaga agrisoli]KAA2240784.1 cytochrome c [Chitinophaga agrisoli]